MEDTKLHCRKKIVWDAHCCVPLIPNYDISSLLERHYKSGFHFVSLNVGMDMIPVDHIFSIINSFREKIKESDFLILASCAKDIEEACDNKKLAVAFDLEGGVPFLESEFMVELFYQLGVRQALLAYNRNNTLAAGCCDVDAPLSKKGKRLISSMVKYGMLIDCSHMGKRSSLDIMQYAETPVIFSHSNISAIWDHERNLQDVQIKACADTGGVICISGLSWLLGDGDSKIDNFLQHISYVIDLVGVKHVGIGLDYVYDDHIDDIPQAVDHAFWWPSAAIQNRQFSASFVLPEKISLLKSELLKEYSRDEVDMILGGNMFRLAKEVWK